MLCCAMRNATPNTATIQLSPNTATIQLSPVLYRTLLWCRLVYLVHSKQNRQCIDETCHRKLDDGLRNLAMSSLHGCYAVSRFESLPILGMSQ